MDEALRALWSHDAGTGAAAEGVFEALMSRYREPHRHYHTTKHVAAVLVHADELLAVVPVLDPGAVRLAAWFHDAVYDPRATTNEAASAALAQRELSFLGHGPARCDAVARLVLATAHTSARTASVGDHGTDVLLDADLAILAAEPSVYDAYVHGVRAEYAFVDDAGWRAGRAAVLHAFLDREAIFATAPMREREARARANLAAELATLHPPGPSP